MVKLKQGLLQRLGKVNTLIELMLNQATTMIKQFNLQL